MSFPFPVSFFDRTLTELDAARLRRWHAAAADTPLDELLDGARLVPSRDVPADVVTVYSQVQLREGGAEAPRRLTLCYPADAEPGSGFVSVLSPVGLALLGLRAGDVAHWAGPDGRARTATIEAILFQPEASGDYTT